MAIGNLTIKWLIKQITSKLNEYINNIQLQFFFIFEVVCKKT